MRRRVAAISVVAVALVALLGGGAMTSAQDATPEVAPAVAPPPSIGLTLRDQNDRIVGSATLNQGEDGIVTVVVTAQGLPPGDHGVHIHETGVCDPDGDEPFASTGGHFNPTGATHGGPPAVDEAMASPVVEGQGHAADLGNLTVDEQGNVRFEIKSDRFTLSTGELSLQDDDGSALVIHTDPDDLMTDPAGNSGGRIACGVIFAPTAPIGTPEATPTM